MRPTGARRLPQLFFILLLVLGSGGASRAAEPRDGLERVPMERLRSALRADEAMAQCWFRLRAGDSAGARVEAMSLVKAAPRNADRRHLLGIAAAAAGKDAQAEAALRRSLHISPDGWVALQLVNLLLSHEKARGARRVVDVLAAPLGDDLQVLRARAYLLAFQEDFDGARALLEDVAARSEDGAAQFHLAGLLAAMGDSGAALKASAAAVARTPLNGGYRRDLFERLVIAGAWERLIEVSNEAGAEAAGGGLASYYRGVALARLQRDDEARKALAGVAQHGQPDPIALAGSAGLLLQLGAYPDAERAARLALRERGEDGALHHLLAMILTRQNRESEALAYYRRAASLQADGATYRFDLLVSLCSLKRGAELREALERGAKDFPEDPRFGELAARCLAPGG